MKRIVLSIAVGLAAILAAGVLSFLLRPFSWFERIGKAMLRRAGLERSEIVAPRGRLVYWKGGHGRTLVLLHGANDQGGAFSLIAKPLARQSRLVVPDLPGHGESAPADGPLSVADLVTGVETLVQAEAGAGKAVLLGNSLGGYLAMVYAHRHPERVEQVILLNGAAVRADPGAEINLLPKSRDEARKTIEALTDPASPRVPAFVLDDLVRRTPTSPLARLLRSPIDASLMLDGRLGELQVPVTLLWGESDKYMPVAYAESVAKQLRASRLERLPGCGHVPQRECPNRVVPLIERALREPPAPLSALDPSSQN